MDDKENHDEKKTTNQNENEDKANENKSQNELLSYKIKLNASDEIIVPSCNYVKHSYSEGSPNLQLELDWM